MQAGEPPGAPGAGGAGGPALPGASPRAAEAAGPGGERGAAAGGQAHAPAAVEPGGASGGGGAAGAAKAPISKRSEELLLKNRKAQRRFRERQKSKITELEEKNAELAADMRRLQQENQNLDARMTALVRLVHQKNAQLDQLRSAHAAGWEDEAAAAFTDDVVLTWGEGRVFALTPEQVRALSREDLSKIWKEYVLQLAPLLHELDSKPPGGTPGLLEHLQRLTHELTMVLLRVSICSPLVARGVAAGCLEEGSLAEENLEASCRAIMSSLLLSGEQRGELVQLRQLFLAKQAGIMEQRGEALAALLGSMQGPPGGAGERAASSHFLKAHDASAALRQSLREEHALKLDFLSTVMKHLITPEQLARLVVASWPWFPDTLALTTWLAAEAGDPQAAAFFAAARALPPAPLPAAPPALSLASRGGGNSGFSTPRHATPTTPPRTTAAATPFHLGVGQPLSPGGAHGYGMGLLPQHSAHSALSPAVSQLYSPHASPSPGPSPPLSPSHLLPPGQPPPPH